MGVTKIAGNVGFTEYGIEGVIFEAASDKLRGKSFRRFIEQKVSTERNVCDEAPVQADGGLDGPAREFGASDKVGLTGTAIDEVPSGELGFGHYPYFIELRFS